MLSLEKSVESYKKCRLLRKSTTLKKESTTWKKSSPPKKSGGSLKESLTLEKRIESSPEEVSSPRSPLDNNIRLKTRGCDQTETFANTQHMSSQHS